jgi:Spy/CpxP family protein refolding chaperone
VEKVMRALRMSLCAIGLLIAFLTVVAAQPPGEPPSKGDKAKGRPRDGGPGGGVHIIPPFVRDSLNLTEDQQKKIADLEKEMTDKLMKILTAEQQKQLKEARPPRRPGGPDGGPPGKGGPPPGGPPPRDPDQ